MKEKIKIAELLKDCPIGMELNCLMYEDVYFDYVDEFNMIRCYIQWETHKTSLTFNQYGTPNDVIKSKCVIFPKGKTTWEGFIPPCKFKDGDIIVTGADCAKIGLGNTWISIFEENRNGGVATYVDYCNEGKDFHTYLDDKGLLCMKEDIIQQRLATEEEKAKLFKVIEDNGYKWNAETKTLEKLVQPKFKVGDKAVYKDDNNIVVINEIKWDNNVGDIFYNVKRIDENDCFLCPPELLKPYKETNMNDDRYQETLKTEVFGYTIGDVIFTNDTRWIRITKKLWDCFAEEHVYEGFGVINGHEYKDIRHHNVTGKLQLGHRK